MWTFLFEADYEGEEGINLCVASLKTKQTRAITSAEKMEEKFCNMNVRSSLFSWDT